MSRPRPKQAPLKRTTFPRTQYKGLSRTERATVTNWEDALIKHYAPTPRLPRPFKQGWDDLIGAIVAVKGSLDEGRIVAVGDPYLDNKIIVLLDTGRARTFHAGQLERLTS